MSNPPARLKFLAENFDGRVSFYDGAVVFDSEEGAGATPNNANSRYMGCAVLMQPKVFLSLVLPLEHPTKGTIDFLPTVAESPGWGPPMLYLNSFDAVYGHEGRHRAKTFARLCPKEDMLVHILPRGDAFRARHLTYEILSEIRTGLFMERGWVGSGKYASQLPKTMVWGPLFDVAFVENKIITWP